MTWLTPGSIGGGVDYLDYEAEVHEMWEDRLVRDRFHAPVFAWCETRLHGDPREAFHYSPEDGETCDSCREWFAYLAA